jgi:hypothetical protein
MRYEKYAQPVVDRYKALTGELRDVICQLSALEGSSGRKATLPAFASCGQRAGEIPVVPSKESVAEAAKAFEHMRKRWIEDPQADLVMCLGSATQETYSGVPYDQLPAIERAKVDAAMGPVMTGVNPASLTAYEGNR